MSVIHNDLLLATDEGGYNLTKSLRFRSSASAYLNRTPASNSGNQIFTASFWVKRGKLETQGLFYAYSNANAADGFSFQGDVFDISFYAGGAGYLIQLTTAQVFRDPASWYHIVVAIDTTQATASNRAKIYVNGSQVTSFSTATYPTQNSTFTFNTACVHTVGATNYTTLGSYFDGYVTEINWITGQALTPSSFGETDSITGVWKPKRYTGSYGTNGFYLPFTDVATTSGSNAGLGKDFSGNSNYWNTNNISVTSGSTYDSMTDVPTLTSATAANYAVLNPLTSVGTNGSLSDGNLTDTGGANPAKVFTSTIAVKNGNKFYAEFKLTGGANYAQVAVVDILSISTTSGGMRGSGQIVMECNAIETAFYINSSTKTVGSGTFATNDIVMIAFDSTTRNVWFGKNGTWLNSGDPSTASNPIGAVANTNELNFAIRAESTTITANFGQQGFVYTPPTGYKALNTYNLPDSTIVAGNKVMDATTYTSTGTTQAVVNSGGFKPDLVWTKGRDYLVTNLLFDSTRGVTKYLESNSTNAETTDSTNFFNSFNSNGFSHGTGNYANGHSIVAWQWQAGQGTTSSNTSGSITSTVSVNASAGFSIVTYTGTGAVLTFGHGLGATPSFIIMKTRNQGGAGYKWVVYHSSIGNTGALFLNGTDATSTSSGYWNNTSPNSSVVTIGTAINTSGTDTFVAYCWTPIPGFSQFGSYTGNGSTDGTFCYTGFRPKWVMVKSSSTANTSWLVFDSARDSYNQMEKMLYPNGSDAEGTNVNYKIDFLSNGFKLRGNGDGLNANGQSLIFAAFAENPQKYALAK